jgi:hypothetical protein
MYYGAIRYDTKCDKIVQNSNGKFPGKSTSLKWLKEGEKGFILIFLFHTELFASGTTKIPKS